MIENHQVDLQPDVTTLVGGILKDAKKLVWQEIALAQREVKQEWDKGKTAVAWFSGAFVAFVAGAVFLGFMLAMLLHQYLLPNHEWACFGIVGGLFALLFGALIYGGIQQINKVHVTFPQTAEALGADAPPVAPAVSAGRFPEDMPLK